MEVFNWLFVLWSRVSSHDMIAHEGTEFSPSRTPAPGRLSGLLPPRTFAAADISFPVELQLRSKYIAMRTSFSHTVLS